jgi:hypothetical protein
LHNSTRLGYQLQQPQHGASSQRPAALRTPTNPDDRRVTDKPRRNGASLGQGTNLPTVSPVAQD